MPRIRFLVQIDEELIKARASLAFWNEQMLLLADTPLWDTAHRQVAFKEAEIKQLLEAQETLLRMEKV